MSMLPQMPLNLRLIQMPILSTPGGLNIILSRPGGCGVNFSPDLGRFVGAIGVELTRGNGAPPHIQEAFRNLAVGRPAADEATLMGVSRFLGEVPEERYRSVVSTVAQRMDIRFLPSHEDALRARSFLGTETAGRTAASKYESYTLGNYRSIPQVEALPEEVRHAIDVVGQVLPFRTNSYVVRELINWQKAPDDPMYTMNFPRRGMLPEELFLRMSRMLASGASTADIKRAADEMRQKLNPHPANQMKYVVPAGNGSGPGGIQHMYRETVLLFPAQGQSCHAFCTYCFRWPQFSGMPGHKFSEADSSRLLEYLRANPQVTDVLFTGGDPLFMKTSQLTRYLEPLLSADFTNVRSIRLGTKSLSYWPYRYLTDGDSGELLDLFERVGRSGRHLVIMANFNHVRELQTDAVREAIRRIRGTGAQIRTQSPLLAHINDDAKVWEEMWQEQVELGLVPYYMFVARDTGARHYFGVPLARAWEIYQGAISRVSGLARTARGPSMSMGYGKVEILGIQEINGEKVFVLRMLQAVNPDWVMRPFFAKFDPDALWIDELEPFDAGKFFWQ